MPTPFLLRPVVAHEFDAWARVIANTYNEDLTPDALRRERAATELARTLGAFDDGAPVGGTAARARMLTVPGAVVPVAGVTCVGVAPTHRRRGILTALMRRQLADLHESGAEPLAVLRPSEAGIYGRFGYGLATRGAQLRCDKRAMVFRPDVDFGTGSIRLLDHKKARPLLEQVYEQAHQRTVGWPARKAFAWNERLLDDDAARDGATALRFAVHHEADGTATGYALYRVHSGRDVLGNNASTVRVIELAALSHPAHAALWRYLAGIDLVPWLECEAAVDEPLPHLLVDARAVRSSEVDRLWVRLVDVPRALAARRYAVPLDVVVAVADAFCPWNTGHYRLRAESPEAPAACTRSTAEPDLRLTVAELGAAYLGGTTLATLAAAGRVEELRPGALARTSTAFRGEREPCYPGGAAFPAF
ncbi:GNAT family N-acetyltransferase [Kitasatospora sp. LaBMicrA B282]|uniref:GNAT family N-acetyltransferase n=1 Tax=Kitasatospora sp. LaBMicrA B282 TaxID=3420949 RepID=UPI003D1140F1